MFACEKECVLKGMLVAGLDDDGIADPSNRQGDGKITLGLDRVGDELLF